MSKHLSWRGQPRLPRTPQPKRLEPFPPRHVTVGALKVLLEQYDDEALVFTEGCDCIGPCSGTKLERWRVILCRDDDIECSAPRDEGDGAHEVCESKPKGNADRLVTVCASCERASCWHGEFMCDEARTADTKEMAVSELRALALENPTHWGGGR